MAIDFVLLDTSAWVCYFRHQGWEKLKTEIQELLTEGRAVTCWVIKAELLIAATGRKNFDRLREYLSAVPEIPITERVWERASRLGFALRNQGLTIPLPDLLIAQIALESDLALWHVDQHFEEIRRSAPLHTRNFSETTD